MSEVDIMSTNQTDLNPSASVVATNEIETESSSVEDSQKMDTNDDQVINTEPGQQNVIEPSNGPELEEEATSEPTPALDADTSVESQHSPISENTMNTTDPETIPENDLSNPDNKTVDSQNIPDIPSSSSSASQVTDPKRNEQSSEPLVQQVAGASAESESQPSVYHVKWIMFKESNLPIITQNENGPCPLLAIMNLLILQGKVKLPSMIEIVTSGQLMEYLGDCIFENAPKDISEDALLNYEQNMSDAMAVFHKLQTGLDVNVKFSGVSDFEYTPECIVFDLLTLRLYHGWLVDPADIAVATAITSCSYNQLVEKIITQKQSDNHDLVTEALVAEEFLNRSASQLTYHGLSELSSTLNQDEMCVFFRNNHFSTLYKHKGELFLLVTDQGFLTESNVVWETLSNVEGDGHFVDAQFRTYRKAEGNSGPVALPDVTAGSSQQVDQDYLVALSLQQEQQQFEEQPVAPAAVPVPANTPPQLSDHELALKLQGEEERKVARQQQQAANQRHLEEQYTEHMAEQRERKKERSECTIL